MSMHRIPLTDTEREGLKAHGLGRDIGKPSQLADCFRQGVKWGQGQERSRLHSENTALQSGYDAARLEIASLQAEVAKYRNALKPSTYAGGVVWAGDYRIVRRVTELEVLHCRDMESALNQVAGACVRDLANYWKKQTGGTP